MQSEHVTNIAGMLNRCRQRDDVNDVTYTCTFTYCRLEGPFLPASLTTRFRTRGIWKVNFATCVEGASTPREARFCQFTPLNASFVGILRWRQQKILLDLILTFRRICSRMYFISWLEISMKRLNSRPRFMMTLTVESISLSSYCWTVLLNLTITESSKYQLCSWVFSASKIQFWLAFTTEAKCLKQAAMAHALVSSFLVLQHNGSVPPGVSWYSLHLLPNNSRLASYFLYCCLTDALNICHWPRYVGQTYTCHSMWSVYRFQIYKVCTLNAQVWLNIEK